MSKNRSDQGWDEDTAWRVDSWKDEAKNGWYAHIGKWSGGTDGLGEFKVHPETAMFCRLRNSPNDYLKFKG